MNEIKNASLGKRIGAFMIDFLIATCIQIFLFIPFIMTPIIQKNIDGTEVITRSNLITLVTFTYLILRDLPNGRSVGKKALNLQVRSMDQSPASVLQLTLRNVFVMLYPIEFVWLLATSGRERLGDIAAKTRVFNYESKK
ncbi:MAG: RDD family protein [Kiritimatiellae bacterium]|nr:RDD family protein [Kiritimatiellia bacterium]